MAIARPPHAAQAAYEDLSPLAEGQALNRDRMIHLNNRPEGWFGTHAGEGYVQALLLRFEERNPEAAKELEYIMNEAKWSTGYRDFGRMVLELL